MKILDTFAGIGGFSYAAEKLIGGFETTQFIAVSYTHLRAHET